MDRYTDQFRSLVAEYMNESIEFPQLKEITVAQWTFESGYGTSCLATEFLNFAGLKWREEMNGYARPVEYKAHDGIERYCEFGSLAEFIRGYWHFLERPPYSGWRNRTG